MVDFALLLDDPTLAKKRRDTINNKNAEKRRELRRTVLGMLEVASVKDKMEGFNSEDHPELERTFHDMTGTEKVLFLVDYPFMVLSYLTILPTTQEHFSRLRCLIWPIPGVAFAMWLIFGMPTMIWAYVGAPIALVLLIVFFIGIPRDSSQEPSKPIQFLITLLGCASSCCWMYLLIEMLIDMLNTLGMVMNLESSFLGFTILAIGNALPDALNTLALSKSGQGIMAISGAYNGQLFGLLIGFGISTIKTYIKTGKGSPFPLFQKDRLTNNFLGILVIFTSLFVLMLTWIWSYRNNFVMTRTFARIMTSIYITFVACATYFTFGKSLFAETA